eukprot:TRINITY_DN9036_c0_g3_i1.p1 TRINITY_DN9036_c0_g3~~TRINITY_DN9036_c0_g3_i1.p1  ORF type:complete len:419 (-),score=40.44 TRINITY_DN9036_c0_g3_i1:190-1446(-)
MLQWLRLLPKCCSPCGSQHAQSAADVKRQSSTNFSAHGVPAQTTMQEVEDFFLHDGPPDVVGIPFGGISNDHYRKLNLQTFDIDDMGPFLRLYRKALPVPRDPEREAISVMVENIVDFPVVLTSVVYGFLMPKEGERTESCLLDPGEVYKLAYLSTHEHRDRMACYETDMPFLRIEGISLRVDPTKITLFCGPVERTSEGWCSMAGVSRSECWAVYIEYVPEAKYYIRIALACTCVYSDERRPMKRLELKLQDIRFCQDSCSPTFRDGRSLKSTVDQLTNGDVTVAWLGIRVVDFGGLFFALDNRRLRCAKMAFPQRKYPDHSVPVFLACLSDSHIRKEWEAKFTVGQRISWHDEVKQANAGEAPHAQKERQIPAHDFKTAAQTLMCAECQKLVSKDNFSAAQQKKRNARRCRSCVAK